MCYTKICKPLELISVSLTSKVRWSHFNVRMEHAANFFQDTGFIWESNFLPQKVKCHLNVSGFRRLCFCFRRLCLCSIVAVSHNVSCSCGRRPASNKAKSASSREGGRGKHYLRRKSYTMHCGKWSLPCALRIPMRTPNWDRKKSYFASNKLKIKRQQISKAIYTGFWRLMLNNVCYNILFSQEIQEVTLKWWQPVVEPVMPSYANTVKLCALCQADITFKI